MLSVLTEGALQIERSQESDEGKYECYAENNFGVAYSYGANLYVRGTVIIIADVSQYLVELGFTPYSDSI